MKMDKRYLQLSHIMIADTDIAADVSGDANCSSVLRRTERQLTHSREFVNTSRKYRESGLINIILSISADDRFKFRREISVYYKCYFHRRAERLESVYTRA